MKDQGKLVEALSKVERLRDKGVNVSALEKSIREKINNNTIEK
jgi:post-segregation antitoxin (ccd killing protein)